jgi:transitional endoplasmic reticulum ATPase
LLCIAKQQLIYDYIYLSPPETGKTMLAKAAANEGGAKSFFYLAKPDLVRKSVGSSEKRIKQLFKLAAEMAPSVIFLGKVQSYKLCT